MTTQPLAGQSSPPSPPFCNPVLGDSILQSVSNTVCQSHDSSLHFLGDTQSQPEPWAAAQVQEEQGNIIAWEDRPRHFNDRVQIQVEWGHPVNNTVFREAVEGVERDLFTRVSARIVAVTNKEVHCFIIEFCTLADIGCLVQVFRSGLGWVERFILQQIS